VESDLTALRQCTHTGRPLGGPEFVTQMEKAISRPLAPQKGGRPRKPAAQQRQTSICFVA